MNQAYIKELRISLELEYNYQYVGRSHEMRVEYYWELMKRRVSSREES